MSSEEGTLFSVKVTFMAKERRLLSTVYMMREKLEFTVVENKSNINMRFTLASADRLLDTCTVSTESAYRANDYLVSLSACQIAFIVLISA